MMKSEIIIMLVGMKKERPEEPNSISILWQVENNKLPNR
jgi:hypothetical protein